eukprot:1159424-Pelagomonas_calceolata.AAC.2
MNLGRGTRECKWEQEVSTNEEPPERCECKAPLRHSQQAVVAPRSKERKGKVYIAVAGTIYNVFV